MHIDEVPAWGVMGGSVRKTFSSHKIPALVAGGRMIIGRSENKPYVAYDVHFLPSIAMIIGLVYLAAIHTKSQSKLTQSVNNKIVNSDVYYGLSCCLSIQTLQAIQTAGSCQEKLVTSFDSVFLCCMFYIEFDVVLKRFLKT